MTILRNFFGDKNRKENGRNPDEGENINPYFQIEENEDEELIESFFSDSIEIMFGKKASKIIKPDEKNKLCTSLKDYLMLLHQKYRRDIEFSLEDIQIILNFFNVNIQREFNAGGEKGKEDIYDLFQSLNIKIDNLSNAQNKISEIIANYMFNIDINIKKIFLLVQKYHIYFEHFPNDVIKENEALPLNLYDIGIKNLDGNDKFLGFIDKNNSQRLLKIVFIRHCLVAFLGSEKSDFSTIGSVLLNSLKQELETLKKSGILSNTENKIIKFITGKEVGDKLLTEYKKSFFHKEIENDIDITKRKKILGICLTKPDYFFEKTKIPYKNLLDYIKNQENEKLDTIEKFFERNKKIQFHEEDLLFIFQNNLEDFNFQEKTLTEDINFIKELINKHNCSSEYICSLNRKSFEIIKNSSSLIVFILGEKEQGIEKYQEYESKNSILKKDILYIHPSSPYYQKIQELEKKDISENFSFDNFIQEFETLYEDEEFTNMLNFNKKILRKKSELLEILGSFYILFKNEEKETQEKLIEEIFSLSQENIQFLYEILISNKGILDNQNFHYTSLIGKIGTIIKNKDLFENTKTSREILDGIKLCIEEGENHKQEENNDKNSQISNYFIELYGEEGNTFLKKKNLSSEEIYELNRIGEIIEENNKSILLQHIQENKDINLKGLFALLSFFRGFGIIHFNNFNKIISFTNEKQIEENINHLYKTFSKYNIVNGEKGEFKGIVLKYIKNNKQTIIDDYLAKEKPKEVEVKNNYDRELLKILEEGDEEKINELGKKIEKMINALISLFSPRRTSSMKHNNTGRGSGTFTEIIDNYFIRRLKKEENESYPNYIERIYTFSWLNINNFYNKNDLDREKQLVIESIEKNTFGKQYLFENLENLRGIILDVSNRQIDLSQLKEIYKNILKNEFAKFRDIFGEFRNLENSSQKKNS